MNDIAAADPGFPVGSSLHRGEGTDSRSGYVCKICISKQKNMDPWRGRRPDVPPWIRQYIGIKSLFYCVLQPQGKPEEKTDSVLVIINDASRSFTHQLRVSDLLPEGVLREKRDASGRIKLVPGSEHIYVTAQGTFTKALARGPGPSSPPPLLLQSTENGHCKLENKCTLISK